jgi:phosphoglycolate phosphatase
MALSYRCRLFLFDLDGTLVDSKEDIARAVNTVLARLGTRPLTMVEVLRFVGEGVDLLIRRALLRVTGSPPEEDQVRVAVRLLLDEYERNPIVSTRLYPGVRETLQQLPWARLGLISNKPESLVRRIVAAFGLAERFDVVLGGDSLPQRKPDPAPLREAMTRCGAAPAETVMVGDSPTDIQAGKAAGVITCGITGGFRSREELEAAGSDLIIDRFADLLTHFPPPEG